MALFAWANLASSSRADRPYLPETAFRLQKSRQPDSSRTVCHSTVLPAEAPIVLLSCRGKPIRPFGQYLRQWGFRAVAIPVDCATATQVQPLVPQASHAEQFRCGKWTPTDHFPASL